MVHPIHAVQPGCPAFGYIEGGLLLIGILSVRSAGQSDYSHPQKVLEGTFGRRIFDLPTQRESAVSRASSVDQEALASREEIEEK